MTPTELAALSDLSDLRAWLRDGNAYMEHPDGQDGTDTAVEALDWIVDDRRYLIARGVGDVRAFVNGLTDDDCFDLYQTWADSFDNESHGFRECAIDFRAALLDLCGGSEQKTEADAVAAAPGVDVGSPSVPAPPATPGEPQEVPMSPEKELLSALGIVCREGSWYAPFYNADGSETIMPVREWVTARREAATRLSRAPTERAVEAALHEIDDLAQCIRLTENDKNTSRALLTAQCHALAIQDHLDDLGIKGSLRLAAARTEEE